MYETKNIIVSTYVFVVVGLVLFGFGLYSFVNNYQFSHGNKSERVSGTVVELLSKRGDNGITFAPRIAFTKIDGTEESFISGTGSNPAAYGVGEKVTILYQGTDYRILSFSDLYLLSTILMGFGGAFGGIGLGTLIFKTRRRKIVERLKTSGTPVKAKVTEIVYNTSYKVNGRSPWKITAQSTDAALGISIFESDNIWFNPSEFAPVGKEVTVMVNMAKPKEYWMDVSFLPTVI